MKKILIAGLFMFSVLFSPVSSRAVDMSPEQMQRTIADLQAQINALLAQLQRQQGQNSQPQPGNMNPPTITYIQAKAEDRNILHPNETSTVYGNNLIGVNVFYIDSLGISRQFETANPYNTSIDILTPYVGSIPEGSYSLFAEKNGIQSNKINFSYVNPTDPHSTSLVVRRPANGQTYNMTRRRPGPLNITWSRYTGDFDGYYVMLGNSKLGMGITLTPNRTVSQRSTTLSASASTVKNAIKEMLDNNPGFSIDDVKNDFYIEVMAQRDGRTIASAKGRNFTILNNDPSLVGSSAICRNLEMVWKLNGSEIRREAYTYQTDSCDGYRYLDGHEIGSSCYSEQECRDIRGRGKCVHVGKSKSVCSPQHSLPSITVTTPTTGSVFDNGPTQNIIVGWRPFTGDFDYYKIFIGNKNPSVGGMYSGAINKQSTGYTLVSGDVRRFIENLSGKEPINSFYVEVHAIKNDGAGERDVAIGQSPTFTIALNTSNTPSYPLSVNIPASLVAGSIYNITWTGDFSTPTPGSLTSGNSVYLVKPNGTEIYLGASIGTARSFSWAVPSNLSGMSGLKIKLVRSNVTVGMSNQFSIGQNTTDAERFVTVTSPNSGGSYTVGEQMEVRWSHRGFPSDQKVTIALFRNGSHFTNIATNVSITDGRYGWTIPPGTYDSGAIYKVYVGAVSVTGTRTDYSDTAFSISGLRARITSPASGATLTRGAWYTVNWENAPIGSGDLELFLVNVDGTQTRIATVSGTSRSYQWTVPTNLDPGSSYKLRLYNSGQMIATTDNFSIIRYAGETAVNKTLTVTIPTTSFTKTSWTESFQIPYSWSGSYSIDRSWFQLIDSNGVVKDAGSAGSFVFGSGATSRTLTFPADAGTGTYTVKVCDITLGGVSASSICGTKTIQINQDEKSVRVTHPNSATTLTVGREVYVTWDYTGFPSDQKVTIALFKNGSHLTNIATNVPITDQSYRWVIPEGSYDSEAVYKVYVGAVSVNGTRTDYSDEAFSISPISASPQSSNKENQMANIQTMIQELLKQLQESLAR